MFYRLKLTSVYEYLEQRFDSKLLKVIGVLGDNVYNMTYAAVVLLGPAQALESILYIPAKYSLLLMTIICVIYTSIGGLRGVIWTDVFQSMIMLLFITVIIINGLSNIGIKIIHDELTKRNRTQLNFNPSPFQRSTVWIAIYNSVLFYGTILSQSSMLRYTGVETLNQAKISVMAGSLGCVLFNISSIFIGATILAYYSMSGCGPLSAQKVSSSNQILPYYISETMNYPGIPGLFVAGLVAGSLSTVSSVLNSLSITNKELLLPKLPAVWKAHFSPVTLLNMFVLLIGAIVIGISFVALYSGGTLIQIFFSTFGAINGPIIGIFIAGGAFPFVSFKAVRIGYFSAIIFSLWLSLGNLLHGNLWEKPNLISDTCPSNITHLDLISLNQTTMSTDLKPDTYPLLLKRLYSISPFAIGFLVTNICLVVTLCMSIIPNFRQVKPVESKLLFPFVIKSGLFAKYIKKSVRADKDAAVVPDLQATLL